MAKDEVDLPAFGSAVGFRRFRFIIVGITIHQAHLLDDESLGMGTANELKDRLHFAQLYFCIKYLKKGGMVLMRNHMSTRLVDFHFLSFMLSLFDPAKALPSSKPEPTIVATKPMAEFAIRKTYWVCYQGFQGGGRGARLRNILLEMLRSNTVPTPLSMRRAQSAKPHSLWEGDDSGLSD